MFMTRFVVSIFSVSVMLLGSGLVCAQDYPNKSIRIVTSAAGGNGDFLSRAIAEGISGPLGQKIIVDNRANGLIQGEAVYRAPPDGYTLLLAGGTFWTFPLLQKTSYDPVKDFSPIAMTEIAPLVLVVHPSFIDRGSEVIGSTPAQLAAAVEADMSRSGKMIRALGLRLD